MKFLGASKPAQPEELIESSDLSFSSWVSNGPAQSGSESSTATLELGDEACSLAVSCPSWHRFCFWHCSPAPIACPDAAALLQRAGTPPLLAFRGRVPKRKRTSCELLGDDARAAALLLCDESVF